jgi:hypothetical protein
MQLEAEIRADPFQRADRFVEGWQQFQHHREDCSATATSEVRTQGRANKWHGMAKGLERDAQMESVLREHAHKLDLSLPPVWERGSSISHDLVQSLGLGRGRSLGMSR